MMEYQGRIRNGVVVLEGGAALPEGTRVVVGVRTPTKRAKSTLGKRLLKFAGKARGLPGDLAENHDHYLHGAPKK